jgi:hypothetical protein
LPCASAKVVLGTAFSCVLLLFGGVILFETRKGMDEVCNDLTWTSVLRGDNGSERFPGPRGDTLWPRRLRNAFRAAHLETVVLLLNSLPQ